MKLLWRGDVRCGRNEIFIGISQKLKKFPLHVEQEAFIEWIPSTGAAARILNKGFSSTSLFTYLCCSIF